MRWLIFLTSIITSVSLFGGHRLRGIIGSSASEGRSSNYRLWAVTGIVGYNLLESHHGIEEETTPLNISFYVYNYPNPTHHGVWIEYGIPKDCDVSFKIYDVAGRDIRTLVLGKQKPGIYRLYWNGIDNKGKRVSPGIYFCLMEAGEFKMTKKLTLLR